MRLTIGDVRTRAENLNRRMEKCGSWVRYVPEQRNGNVALDRYDLEGQCLSTAIVGTKREVADYLHAGMQVLDDAVRVLGLLS